MHTAAVSGGTRGIDERAGMIVDDPIELLVKEHEQALAQLEKMSSAARSIQANGFSGPAFLQIAEAIRYIVNEVRRHNFKEEQFLFPLMDKHGNGTLLEMRQEHRELWRAMDELLLTVNDVEDGRIRGSSARELVQSVICVVEHLRNHIMRENSDLFPTVKRLLTESEYDQLRKDIATAALHRQ